MDAFRCHLYSNHGKMCKGKYIDRHGHYFYAESKFTCHVCKEVLQHTRSVVLRLGTFETVIFL